MTNLETNLLEVEHARPYAFVIGPYGFFRPRSRKYVRPSYGTFINGFAKKALAGPYGSYDSICLQFGEYGQRPKAYTRQILQIKKPLVTRQVTLYLQRFLQF